MAGAKQVLYRSYGHGHVVRCHGSDDDGGVTLLRIVAGSLVVLSHEVDHGQRVWTPAVEERLEIH